MEDQNQKPEEPDLTGTYTARDYITWKTEELMELIHGKIFKMTPAPTSGHQEIVMNLGALLHWNFRNRCKVYPAPFDVYLTYNQQNWRGTKNIVQPDLCVVCDLEKIHNRGCIGAPDLVVEILSPTTSVKDIGLKRDLYEEYGVNELWIVHPIEGTITLHLLKDGKYHILPIYTKGQTLQSPTFQDLKVALDEVFTD